MYGTEHKIIPVKKKNKIEKLRCCGPICETSDIFVKKMKIHRLNSDDLVVICSTGAYSSCMASKYNLRNQLKKYLLKKNLFFQQLMMNEIFFSNISIFLKKKIENINLKICRELF